MTSGVWDLIKGLNEVPLQVRIDSGLSGQHSLVFTVSVDLPGHSLVTAAAGIEAFEVTNTVPRVAATVPQPGATAVQTSRPISISFSPSLLANHRTVQGQR